MNYELHPLCSLFPRMSGYEFECLKLDIRENGLRNPITTYKGMILDGGNRFQACVDIGINPTTEEFYGDNITAFVLTSNLHRRHLTVSQSAAIVASVQDWNKAHKFGDNQHSVVTNNHPLDTTKTRSNQSGASISTQKKADAVAKASPELAAQVARGEISLNDATREVAPQLAPKVHVEPEYDPIEHELSEAHSAVIALSEENTKLKDAIAVGNLPESEQSAGEIIVELRAKVKVFEVTLAAVTVSRDNFQRECGELKKQCAMQRKELDKLRSK